MKVYEVKTAAGTRYELIASVIECGEDFSVTICGGSRHHVGAVALGCARPRQEGKPRRSATVSVLCAYEHKDDEMARWAARYLATELDCRVSVAVGVHIEDAKGEEIVLLMEECKQLCQEIVVKSNQKEEKENGKN